MSTPDPFEHSDVAYVFGALDPAESAQFETHLATCAECAARVADTRGITALLDGVTESDIAASAPATLLPGLLRRAEVARRRQRWLVGGLAAVAAACLITLVVLVWPSPTSAPVGRKIAMTALVASPVSASVELSQTSSGTSITVHCTYTSTAGSGARYGLVVLDRNRVQHQLSSWVLGPGGDKYFPATTDLSESQISQVQVTYQGRAILTATL